MTIINVRGCNGSGKTTLVRKLIHLDPNAQKVTLDTQVTNNLLYKTPGHLLPNLETVVVGPYVDGKATGGMDNVHTTDEALWAVTNATRQARNVVFEGALISTVWSTWWELSQDLKPITFAFLDTPADLCVERVKQRRMAKGWPAEGFREDQVRGKHAQIARVREKALAAGQLVVDLDGSLEQLVGLLDK
jgi:thymidylate kinase